MTMLRWGVLWMALLAIAGAPAAARAAITISPGADTVSTSRLDLDFGNGGGNVERLDTIQWRDSGNAQSANLVANSGPIGCAGEANDQWGRAGSIAGPPQPVGAG